MLVTAFVLTVLATLAALGVAATTRQPRPEPIPVRVRPARRRPHTR